MQISNDQIKNQTPKVAVILINYKWYADRFLARAYESLQKLNYPKDKYKIYIADNVTSTETQELLKKLAPEAVVVPSDGNGWGHANNICAKKAMEDGYDDYFAIVNMDTIFHEDFLKESIEVLEEDKMVGIVQSKLLLYPPQKDGSYNLNSRGNSLTFLGFGYCSGDGKVDDTPDKIVDVISAAGAGIVISRELFVSVGMCDESYFMYHDDIELSQKVKMLGYRLVLAPRSIIYHEHEFGRSIMQVYYMERNRFRYILEFYKWQTILLMIPAWLFMELGMLPYQIKGRWMWTKLRVYGFFFKPSTWKLIYSKRKQVQYLRTISDKDFFKGVVAKIDFQQVDNPLLKYVANPIFSMYWWAMKKIISW